MSAKNVTGRVRLMAMQEVALSELLIRARGQRSLREMARRCGLSAMTIHRGEAGTIGLPSQSTLVALSQGYDVPLDVLARAAYGVYYEEVPVTDAALATGSPALVPA